MSRLRAQILITLVCLLAYGLLIKDLGFYIDDWRDVWLDWAVGPEGQLENMKRMRPFLGYLQAGTSALFGSKPLTWHIFSLALRILTGLAVFHLAETVLRERSAALSVALLFSIYPGYSGQPIAYTFSRGLVQFNCLLLSFLFLAKSLDNTQSRHRHWLVGCSILFALPGLLVSEYFYGLELAVRPLLVLAFLRTNNLSRRKAALYYIPFLLIFASVVFWRAFIFAPPNQYSGYNASDLSMSVAFTSCSRALIPDIFKLTLFAWTQTFNAGFTDHGRLFLVASGVVLVGFLLTVFGTRVSQDKAEGRCVFPPIHLCLAGLSITVSAMMPFWLTGRSVTLQTINDRFSLAAILGVATFTYGVLAWALTERRKRLLALAVLVGFSCGFHFLNAAHYRRDWRAQKDFFWQLYWRAPNLKPGTTVLVDDVPFIDRRSYALAGPLNFLYASDSQDFSLRHWAISVACDVGDRLPQLDKDTHPDTSFMGPVIFNGTPAKSISVWYSPNQTLRMLHDSRVGFSEPPRLAQELTRFADPSLIAEEPTENNQGFLLIFGSEPKHEWTWYFQKGELAAQFGRWERVAELGIEVQAKGFEPKDPAEWLVFLEGFERMGLRAQASELADKISEHVPLYRETNEERKAPRSNHRMNKPSATVRQ